MDYLISEHSLNKNLKHVFPNPTKKRSHLIFIDFLCKYLMDNSMTTSMSVPTYDSDNKIKKIEFLSQSEFIEKIIKNKYDSFENYNRFYVEFTYTDFQIYTNTKIGCFQLKNLIEDLSKQKIDVEDFKIIQHDINKSIGLKIPKFVSISRNINDQTLFSGFEFNKLGNSDYQYKIFLDSTIMLYIINNIHLGNFACIPLNFYSWYHVPTLSSIFMKRFVFSTYFKVNSKKLIKFETIKDELMITKSGNQIINQIITPLVKLNYISELHNNKIVEIKYIKNR